MEKTLLFGNGLNRQPKSDITWSKLLETLKGKNTFIDSNLPYIMIYERILLERPVLEDTEGKVKREIADLMHRMPTNKLYQWVHKLNFKNYLTPY